MRTLFLVMGLVLSLSMLSAYMMGRAEVAANRFVLREHGNLELLNTILSTLKDAETGQRGFLLTGKPAYLAPYEEAKQSVRAQLADLRRLAGLGEIETTSMDRLEQLVAAKLAELARTIDLRKSSGFDAAVAVVESDQGIREMDQIRDVIGQMCGVERAAIDAASSRANRLSVARTIVFVLVGLVNLTFLYWAYDRICRDREGLQRAADEILRQKELLGVTLASIGDGVIVTDLEGRITFLNQIAEDLTGWPLAEASGQLCADVFNIVNETTRARVESPVDKVLKLGVVVGLANHTVLIRRDGSEIPIDDSGAPIREGGQIRGAVLVFRDFSDHKNQRAALLAAKEEAEAANVAKDNFLATLSHELRTPLTPVLATLSAWEMDAQLPQPFQADVQMMRRNVDLEARLIDDLLDLTRIVRNKLSLQPELADVHELLHAVSRMYRSDLNARRLTLEMNLQADAHYVRADPGRLHQVISNVLKNATKFTPEGGRIELITRNDAGEIVIDISDNGIGMNAQTLEKMFRPFEQGADEFVRRYGGLGLGMAISKALMDAQGGGIKAQSAGPGAGSTFTVVLPTAEAPAEGNANQAPSRGRAPQRALAILLVEDHVDTSRVVARLLGDLGHRVTVADSVAQATAAVAESNFDLIISDIGLPDGTGLDLIRKLREVTDAPAVALTGFGMEEDVAKCREAGFNLHLTKPVSFQKLEALVSQFAS